MHHHHPLQQLGFLSQRSLQCYLENEGTSFSELVENVRMETAKKYLLETAMPLSRLAELLGYSETSNFSSAFKRETGLAPLECKKSHLNSPLIPKRSHTPSARYWPRLIDHLPKGSSSCNS